MLSGDSRIMFAVQLVTITTVCTVHGKFHVSFAFYMCILLLSEEDS